MFCRQCGLELPDGTAFCRRCGADQRIVATTPPEPVRKSMAPVGIVARAAGIATIVFMLMPWIGVPALRTLGQYASAIGVSGLSGDYTYTLPGLHDVLGSIRSLLSSSQSNMIMAVWIIFLIGWIGCLIALGVGLLRSFTGKRSCEALLGAGVAVVVVAVAWIVVIMLLNSALASEVSRYTSGYLTFTLFEIPSAVYLTVACGLVTAVASHLSRAKASGQVER